MSALRIVRDNYFIKSLPVDIYDIFALRLPYRTGNIVDRNEHRREQSSHTQTK